MKKWFLRAVKALAILLAILMLGLTITGFWLTRRAWPRTEGEIAVKGLTASVQVARDSWGIPHIYGEQENDLFFAQGYVHAQDRLWQMHLNRMVADGTLAATIGKMGLEPDRFSRSLGLRRTAQREWENLDPETRGVLVAYSAGVNAYLEEHRDQLPIEFVLLQVDPGPWTPVDSLAAMELIGLNLGLNMMREMLRVRFVDALGEQSEIASQRLLAPYPADGPVIVATVDGEDDDSDATGGLDTTARLDATDRLDTMALAAWFGELAPTWGSNAWVVAGSRTASGKPLLANDTHMALPTPSIWYENGLHGGRFNVVGFSIPGVPAVALGHNGSIAWGITNLFTDAQDLYFETLDDTESPQRYRFRDAWRDLETIEETIEVKGKEPEKFIVRLTHHGPIVNDAFPKELANQPPIALSWTAFQGVGVARALLDLNLAGDWAQFREALSGWYAPSLSFVYADTEGNIGFQAAGRQPIRAPGHDGTAPVSGAEGESEWQGYIPFDELPTSFNPESGILVSANNKVVDDGYPYVLTRDWADPHRARRILDLLEGEKNLNREDMIRIQADTFSLLAESLRPYLLGVEPASDLEKQALVEFEQWDLRYEVDRAGASIYHVWHWFVLRDLIGDELEEELMKDFRRFPFHQTSISRGLLGWDANPWFDDRDTPQVETREDLLQRSFSRAVAWLAENYGDDPAKWSWGRLHRAEFGHMPLGQAGVAPLDWFFNAGSVPAPGGPFTVNAATPSLSRPFIAIAGASQRFIADLNDLSQSLAVNSTGQSGQTFHAHRGDQVALWQAGDYHSVFFDRASVDKAVEGVLTLTPQ